VQLCKDVELKNQNKAAEQPRSQTEASRSQTQATIGPNHALLRVVDNWNCFGGFEAFWRRTDGQTDGVLNFLVRYLITTPNGVDKC